MLSRKEKKLRKDIRLDGFSPRYAQNESRRYAGIPSDVDGSYALWCARAAKGSGCCRARVWRYVPLDTSPKPWYADADARRFRILEYYRLSTVGQVMEAIYVTGTALLTIFIFEGFMRPLRGVVPMPVKGEPHKGLHVIAACGYSQGSETVTIINSWGTKWGDKGFGYLPFDYIRRYTLEAYAQRGLLSWVPWPTATPASGGFVRGAFALDTPFSWRPTQHFVHITDSRTGVLAGWLHHSMCGPPGTADIDDVCVRPEYRRKGVGSHLLALSSRLWSSVGVRRVRVRIQYPDLIPWNRPRVLGFLRKHDFGVRRKTDKFGLEYWDAEKGLPAMPGAGHMPGHAVGCSRTQEGEDDWT